ncbi:hypothetical protein HanPI659440_Chr09g0336361 [Helianthus annuus]|nr:hypothetical protein HanPI659440_Chr09g0336361 [Helianthus annuus]
MLQFKRHAFMLGFISISEAVQGKRDEAEQIYTFRHRHRSTASVVFYNRFIRLVFYMSEDAWKEWGIDAKGIRAKVHLLSLILRYVITWQKHFWFYFLLCLYFRSTKYINIFYYFRDCLKSYHPKYVSFDELSGKCKSQFVCG